MASDSRPAIVLLHSLLQAELVCPCSGNISPLSRWTLPVLSLYPSGMCDVNRRRGSLHSHKWPNFPVIPGPSLSLSFVFTASSTVGSLKPLALVRCFPRLSSAISFLGLAKDNHETGISLLYLCLYWAHHTTPNFHMVVILHTKSFQSAAVRVWHFLGLLSHNFASVDSSHDRRNDVILALMLTLDCVKL